MPFVYIMKLSWEYLLLGFSHKIASREKKKEKKKRRRKKQKREEKKRREECVRKICIKRQAKQLINSAYIHHDDVTFMVK